MSGPAYEEVLLKYYDLVNERVGLGYLLKITWYQKGLAFLARKPDAELPPLWRTAYAHYTHLPL